MDGHYRALYAVDSFVKADLHFHLHVRSSLRPSLPPRKASPKHLMQACKKIFRVVSLKPATAAKPTNKHISAQECE